MEENDALGILITLSFPYKLQGEGYEALLESETLKANESARSFLPKRFVQSVQ
jgi:hypothetical protein